MNALSLLKEDHDRVKRMLAEGEQTTERAEKTRSELLMRLKHDLEIHERMEEEVLYPALKQKSETREIALEAFEEHHVVDMILQELEQTPVTDESWSAKFMVVKENLEHHIEEEEGEMFRTAREVFSREELDEMGQRMMEIKQAAQELTKA